MGYPAFLPGAFFPSLFQVKILFLRSSFTFCNDFALPTFSPFFFSHSPDCHLFGCSPLMIWRFTFLFFLSDQFLFCDLSLCPS